MSNFLSIKLIELEGDEYKEFNDYLEMIVQFGYNTLYAAAIPIGALFSFVVNIIELWSDKFKL